MYEKFYDFYFSFKELSVKLVIFFCIKKVDFELEKVVLMNGVYISFYKKFIYC